MANEISYTANLSATKSNLSLSRASGTLRADLTGAKFYNAVQNIGTSYEAIAIGDVASAGFAWFKNHDATNYVEIGLEVSAAFYAFVKLKPGEVWMGRLATTTIFGRANTGAVNLETMLIEN